MEDILLFVPNWLGDCVMALPAIEHAINERKGKGQVVLVGRASVFDFLKEVTGNRARVVLLPKGIGEQRKTVLSLRREHSFKKAYVLPNSFRAALLATQSGAEETIGFKGQFGRRVMLKSVRPVPRSPYHQALKYFALISGQEYNELTLEEVPLPAYKVNSEEIGRWRSLAMDGSDQPCRLVALAPGAARGPSKQWPVDHFITLAQRLVESGVKVVIVGGPSEKALGQEIASAAGAVNLCGETRLSELPRLLTGVDAVVSNDSGIMHVAGALKRPVVALFGTTDPAETGPLGGTTTILQKSDKRSRKIARSCPIAEAALRSITPDEAFNALKLQA